MRYDGGLRGWIVLCMVTSLSLAIPAAVDAVSAEQLAGQWEGQAVLAGVQYTSWDTFTAESEDGELLIYAFNTGGSYLSGKASGDLVFRLNVEGSLVRGTYYQRFENPHGCNPPKDQPVHGKVTDNGNTIVLQFTYEGASPWRKTINSPIQGCAGHYSHRVTLTMKRIE